MEDRCGEEEWPILKRLLTTGRNDGLLISSKCFCYHIILSLFHFFLFSFTAVRFGRVPKREKAKILAAMQSVNARLAERSLPSEFADEVQLMQAVVRAHMETCDFTRDKVQVLMADAHRQPNYTACPPTLVRASFIFIIITPFRLRQISLDLDRPFPGAATGFHWKRIRLFVRVCGGTE